MQFSRQYFFMQWYSIVFVDLVEAAVADGTKYSK